LRLLLDSHVVLWLTADVPRRSVRTLDAIVDEANEALVGAVSVWELEIKRLKGQLDAPRGRWLPPAQPHARQRARRRATATPSR